MPKPTPQPKPLNIKGTAGNDTLTGGVLGDTIDGGKGNDIIIGDTGADSLTGGQGADRFRYLSFAESSSPGGIDRINDFNPAAGDSVDLTALGTATFRSVYDPTFTGLQAIFAYDALTNTTTLAYYQGSNTAVFQINFTGSVNYSPTAFLGLVNPPPVISIADSDAIEGADLSFTLTRTGELGAASTVSYTLSDGTTGTVTFTAGEGSNSIIVPTTEDNVVGNGGSVTVTLSNPTNATISDGSAVGTVTDDDVPTEDDDNLVGTSGNDTIDLLAGNDTYDGLEGNDTIDGGSGTNQLGGGAGDDTFRLNANSVQDVVSGGDGFDTYDASGHGVGIYVQAGSMGGVNGTVSTHVFTSGTWAYLVADITGVENWIGTNFSDNFQWNTTFSITAHGLEGDDSLYGGQANDFLYGDAGDDTLQGGWGDDYLDGGDGIDRAVIYSVATPANFVVSSNFTVGSSEHGTDTYVNVERIAYNGSDLADQVTGGAYTDVLYGYGGDDILNGGAGNDFLFGFADNDTLNGGTGDDNLSGGDGNDTVIFSAGRDTYDGGAGFDTLDYSQASGSIYFEAGEPSTEPLPEGYGITVVTSVERFVGSNFDDYFNFDFINHSVVAETGDGDDEVIGTSSGDRFIGGLGNDTLIGGDGSDILVGNAGNDSLEGGGGDDWLVGAEGDDTIDGGTGDVDRALFYLNPANVGTYTLVAGPDPNTQFVTLVNGEQSEVVAEITTAADGSITISGIGVSSYLGADTVTNVDRLIFSNLPADPFTNPVTGNYLAIDAPTYVPVPTEGADDLVGTAGDDTVDLLGGNDVYDGLAGNDNVIGGADHDKLDGGDGNDSLDGGSSDDQIAGGGGHDRLIGGLGNDTLSGDDGNDAVVGKAGNDILNGGAGNDFIVGDQGDDTIDGGTGDTDYAVFYFPTFMVGTYSLVAGTGADAGKQLVMFDDGMSQDVVAKITKAADGTITVVGVGAGAFLGTDTALNVDRLLFSSVSSDPFVTPTMPGYLAFDVSAVPVAPPPPEPANAILLSSLAGGQFFNVSAAGEITNSGISLPNWTGDYSYGLAAGYVNDDPYMDALILSDYGGARLWYGTGDGTFTDSGARFASAFQTRGSIADFNNDGLGDIVVINVLGSMDVYMNTATGFIKTYSLTDIGSTGFYRTPAAAIAADLNGDGFLDLYVVESDDVAPATDKILFGDGSGGFSESGIQLGQHSALDPSGAAIGDINGDGALDIVRASATGAFSLLINNGAGEFTPSGAAGPSTGTRVMLGDFDRNGTLDALVRLAPQDGGLQWWSNDGYGNFTFAQSIAPDFTPAGVADFNGDGVADLYGSTGAALVTYLNDGTGTFELADSYAGVSGSTVDFLFI